MGALPLMVGTLLLAGCGNSTIVPAGAERSVAETVSQHTRFHLLASAVHCPSGIEAKAGVTFTCRFNGPAGRAYAADLRVVSVNGTKVIFYVNTRLSH